MGDLGRRLADSLSPGSELCSAKYSPTAQWRFRRAHRLVPHSLDTRIMRANGRMPGLRPRVVAGLTHEAARPATTFATSTGAGGMAPAPDVLGGLELEGGSRRLKMAPGGCYGS